MSAVSSGLTWPGCCELASSARTATCSGIFRLSQAKDFRQDAIARAKQAAKERHTKYSTEAFAAIRAVEHAMGLLNAGKDDKAIKKLQDADGKLEIAIAADPELKLIPVAASVMTFDLLTTPKAVTDELDVVKDRLQAGNVQDARVRRMHTPCFP